jgi:hypothetical protein
MYKNKKAKAFKQSKEELETKRINLKKLEEELFKKLLLICRSENDKK